MRTLLIILVTGLATVYIVHKTQEFGQHLVAVQRAQIAEVE